jgi:hypothetical protein
MTNDEQTALLERAHAAYLTYPRDSGQRRQIEYISGRLRAPLPSDPIEAARDKSSRDMLAGRLADIIRPRNPGGFG